MKLIKWTEQVQDHLKWKGIVEKAKTVPEKEEEEEEKKKEEEGEEEKGEGREEEKGGGRGGGGEDYNALRIILQCTYSSSMILYQTISHIHKTTGDCPL